MNYIYKARIVPQGEFESEIESESNVHMVQNWQNFFLKIGNRAIVEETVGDDIVLEVFIERIRTPGGDKTPGDGKVDGDIGGDEHFVTVTETSNVA